MDPLRKLYPYIKPYRRRLMWAFVLTPMTAFLATMPPRIQGFYFTRIIEAKTDDLSLLERLLTPAAWWSGSAAGLSALDRMLLPTCLAILGVPLVINCIDRLNAFILSLAGMRFVTHMRLSMYRRLLNQDMRFHGETLSGSLVGRLMDDVGRIQNLLTEDMVRLLIDVVIFLVSVVSTFFISWVLGLFLLGMLVFYVLGYRHYGKRIRAASRSFRAVFDQMNGRLQENLVGVRSIRIYGREDDENDLFSERQARALDRSLSMQMSNRSLALVCNLTAGAGTTLLCGAGALLIIRGHINFGDLMVANTYAWMAINPAVRLTGMMGQFADIFVSVNRIHEIMEDFPRVVSAPGAPDLPPGPGAVEFRNVDFAYDPAKPLYRGLSLKVEPGWTMAFVGHTGCGKTSFVSLLMRQWDVDGGQIVIDGADIARVRLRSLREAFGVVLQDPVLFEGAIAENLAYGDPRASRAAIEEAARAAEIHDTIMRLPDKYDTLLGPRGIKLSVGQKQRLGIARALLLNPRILVMDEATSSLDSESESLIQKALAKLMKGRTSFVIAHRLSTIRNADRIVVMDAGAIVELGTHDELMAIEGGHYRHLYEEMLGRGNEQSAMGD